MHKNDLNAIQRARKSAGITQEKLAEMTGYSAETIKAWETGTRRAGIEALDMLASCLGAPWLTPVYLREQSSGGTLECAIPQFTPGMGVSQSAVTLINRIYAFADQHNDRKLLAIAEDNVIEPGERDEFNAIMKDLQEIVAAAMTLRYSKSEAE